MTRHTPEPKPELQAFVSEYYGNVLRSGADLKTNACCASGAPPKWIAERLANVHSSVHERFYGCGFPIPHGLKGATVLDLGCGAGRDAYVLAQLVGPNGHVHGIDMTEEQLGVARQTMVWHQNRFAYPAANTSFHQAYIEDLRGIGVEPGSVDVVVSNCVVNLSPRKDLVLSEAFRMLKPGGEFYVSDVVADRRLPKTIANDPLLFVECLGGALYEADFVSAARRAGFLDPRTVARSAISIQDPEIVSKLGTARFTSVTYRLFKLQELDEQCEDYGQSAVYQGGLEGAEALFWLDDQHAFEVGRAERICGNTAKMLAKTRFARWFRIAGSHSVHFGTFPCGLTLAAQQYQSTEQESCC